MDFPQGEWELPLTPTKPITGKSSWVAEFRRGRLVPQSETETRVWKCSRNECICHYSGKRQNDVRGLIDRCFVPFDSRPLRIPIGRGTPPLASLFLVSSQRRISRSMCHCRAGTSPGPWPSLDRPLKWNVTCFNRTFRDDVVSEKPQANRRS